MNSPYMTETEADKVASETVDRIITFLKNGDMEKALQFQEGSMLCHITYVGGFFLETQHIDFANYTQKLVNVEPLTEDEARFALTARHRGV